MHITPQSGTPKSGSPSRGCDSPPLWRDTALTLGGVKFSGKKLVVKSSSHGTGDCVDGDNTTPHVCVVIYMYIMCVMLDDMMFYYLNNVNFKFN